MARGSKVAGKFVAAVMAGVIGFTYAGGALVSTAYAQPKPPTATAPGPTGKTPAGTTPTTAGASAGTATPSTDPKKAYADGEKKFKANDYAAALADFQVADSAKPTAQAARYIALCQDNLGHYPEAVAAYERFLADVPAKDADKADEVKRRVAAIKVMPGKIHVETTPTGATIALDGKALTAVSPTDVDATPGHHTLKISAEGRASQEKDLDVAYASKQDLKVDLEESAPAAVPPPPPPPEPVAATPPPPPPPQPDKGSSMVPAIITGGLAVVAIGVGTVFGIMALSDKSDFDKNPTSSKADDGENHALIADMAFGVAVTLGVTSAVLFFSSGGASASAAKGDPATLTAKAKPKTYSFAPIVTPHGGGAGATFQF